MSYKRRCTEEGNVLKLWLVLLFRKGCNLCLFTISTYQLHDNKCHIFQDLGGVYGGGGCWVAGGGGGMGGMHLQMRG